MDILHILVVLIVVGVVLWLVQTYIPMASPIKTVITVVVVLLLCLWLLSLFGIGGYVVAPRR
jgi:hypothetical protein